MPLIFNSLVNDHHLRLKFAFSIFHPTYGYELAQTVAERSNGYFELKEGSLYPALQRILVEGWATAAWGESETGRRVRFYKLTPAGLKQLKREMKEYQQATAAIQAILRLA